MKFIHITVAMKILSKHQRNIRQCSVTILEARSEVRLTFKSKKWGILTMGRAFTRRAFSEGELGALLLCNVTLYCRR
jgi:hypothetical protein